MKLLEGTKPDVRRVITARQRRTCLLAWTSNLKRADIAAAHGISPKAVAMRLYRARQRLRKAGIEPPSAMRASLRTPAFQLESLENI
jgi:DNA-directed RNA polymerase specialized sigma24 family protein